MRPIILLYRSSKRRYDTTRTVTRGRRLNIVIWFNKYRILGAVTDDVFLAEHIALQEKRIIKRICKDSPYYERLSHEAQTLKRLHFQGIPRLEDQEEDEDYLYLIEEYIEGATLRDVITTSTLSPRRIHEILYNICKIIEYFHKQNPPVYHLDLNPDNVMITPTGEVYIVDLGASITEGMAEDNCMQFGMKGFAAPEMYEKGKAGPYSDVYSIGAIIYYILTGKKYDGDLRLGYRKLIYGKLLKRTLNTDFKKRPDITQIIRMLNKGKEKKESITVKPEVRTVGFMGLAAGNGTTFLSLLLAEYLAKQTDMKIAYVEHNLSGDCSAIKEFQSEFPTNLILVENVDTSQYTDLLNEDIDVLVVDFGTDSIGGIDDFIRCDRKILVGSDSPWKYRREENAYASLEIYFRCESWRFIRNLSGDRFDGKSSYANNIIGYNIGFEKLHDRSENTEQIFSKLITRR